MKYIALMFMLGVSTYVLGGLIADMRGELRSTQGILRETRIRVEQLEEAHDAQREHIEKIIELLGR